MSIIHLFFFSRLFRRLESCGSSYAQSIPVPVPTQKHNYQRMEHNLQESERLGLSSDIMRMKKMHKYLVEFQFVNTTSVFLISGQQHLHITFALMGLQHVGEPVFLQIQEDPDHIYLPHRVKKPVLR